MQWLGSRPARKKTGASCQVATGEEPRHGLRFRKLVDRKRQVWLVRMVAAAKRLDLDRLDLDRLVRARKAEALAVHRLERAL